MHEGFLSVVLSRDEMPLILQAEVPAWSMFTTLNAIQHEKH